jgi:hypothetical protein
VYVDVWVVVTVKVIMGGYGIEKVNPDGSQTKRNTKGYTWSDDVDVNIRVAVSRSQSDFNIALYEIERIVV